MCQRSAGNADVLRSLMGINLARLATTASCSITDLTYCTPAGFILGTSEETVGVMVACVPTLGPIFFPRSHEGSHRRDDYRSQTAVLRNETRTNTKSRYTTASGDDDAELLTLSHTTSPLPPPQNAITVERKYEVVSHSNRDEM